MEDVNVVVIRIGMVDYTEQPEACSACQQTNGCVYSSHIASIGPCCIRPHRNLPRCSSGPRYARARSFCDCSCRMIESSHACTIQDVCYGVLTLRISAARPSGRNYVRSSPHISGREPARSKQRRQQIHVRPQLHPGSQFRGVRVRNYESHQDLVPRRMRISAVFGLSGLSSNDRR
jgi:hypothetical protein